MAKMMFAAVATVCALVAISGMPALGQALGQAPLLLSAKPADLPSWPTDTLDIIDQALQALEDKAQQMWAEAENAMQIVEKDAPKLANRWTGRLQEWVGKAKEAFIDVNECVNSFTHLVDNVVDKLNLDSKQCLSNPIKALDHELQELRGKLLEVKAVQEDASDLVSACSMQGNPIHVIMCLGTNLPDVQVNATSVSTSFLRQVGEVAGKAAAMQTTNVPCTATVYAQAGAQASAIVNSTISCIKDKLH